MQVESLYADPVVAEIHEVRRRLLESSGQRRRRYRISPATPRKGASVGQKDRVGAGKEAHRNARLRDQSIAFRDNVRDGRRHAEIRLPLRPSRSSGHPALLGLQRASFFTALEEGKFFVEPGNQLSNACFCEALFTDWMLALQPLESSLQVLQLRLGLLVFGFGGDHGFISAFDSTCPRIFQFQP